MSVMHRIKTYPPSYWVTVASVCLVAFVAAVVSYSHIVDIAKAVGEDWRSYWVPLSMDGLVTAASMTMMVRKSLGRSYGWLPLSTLAIGVTGSMVSNVASAVNRTQTVFGNHDIAVAIAGFVPLAFLAAFHMLLSQRGLFAEAAGSAESPTQRVPEGEQDSNGVAPVGDALPVPAPYIPVTGLSDGPLRASATRINGHGSQGTYPVGTSNGHGPDAALAGGSRDLENVLAALLAAGLPLAELQSATGHSVNGNGSRSTSVNTMGPVNGGSNSSTSAAPSPSARTETSTRCSDTVEDSGVGAQPMPAELRPYLDDELYALESRNGHGRSTQDLSTDRRSSAPDPSGAGQRSLNIPAQPSPERKGPREQVNGAAAHPTPTTPPPRSPHPGLPTQPPGSVSGQTASAPPTTAEILAYLDGHQDVSLKQAARNLGISESTLYRAKRTRAGSTS